MAKLKLTIGMTDEDEWLKQYLDNTRSLFRGIEIEISYNPEPEEETPHLVILKGGKIQHFYGYSDIKTFLDKKLD